MTLRTVNGQRKAEDVDDLVDWLRGLSDCPAIDRTEIARCTQPAHGDEPATWFYVEADAAAGVARLRCLACGHARNVLDSAERWTFPPTWSCTGCSQSIAEVAFGISAEADLATWVALAVRCVGCGNLEGLTDLVIPGTDIDALAASL